MDKMNGTCSELWSVHVVFTIWLLCAGIAWQLGAVWRASVQQCWYCCGNCCDCCAPLWWTESTGEFAGWNPKTNMFETVAQYMLENYISDGLLWSYRLCSHELWHFGGMYCFCLQVRVWLKWVLKWLRFSHVMNGDQLASPSWCQAHLCSCDQIFV